jgi:beta-lactamase regulating signal transducer with metallopeptidase domain
MWLLSHTLGVLLLLMAILAVCRWLRPGPTVRHALWLLLLLKLLMPPFVSWPWTLPVLPAARPEPLLVIHGEDMRLSLPKDNESASDETPAALPIQHVSPREVAVIVWLCGGLVAAFVQLRRLMCFRRWLRQTRPAPAWLASEVGDLASMLKVEPPRLALLPGLGSPFVWLGGRACLLWPEGLENELSPEGRRAVLAHELAHLARRDHWIAWLLLAAGCVWWWHPLFYLLRRRLHREAELACDALVVSVLPEARRAYAEALLDVCQRQTETTALAPTLGAAGRRRDLERRLVMIMRENVPSRLSPRLLAAVGLLGLIALPGWTLGQMPGWTLGQSESKDGKTAATEREKRLHELETKLREVMKDLEGQQKQATLMPNAPGSSNWSYSWAEIQAPAFVNSNREKKLEDVEAKLKALLKEVQALRSINNNQVLSGALTLDFDNDGNQDIVIVTTQPSKPVEVALTRTMYRLPATKAEALGKFLQQHIKADVMETKIEGDKLTVTTTPEVQRSIRQFIALMEQSPSSQKK